ncbi:hypothetical protein I5M27_07300 [Adhaeribacter sp. BT258]|uniref:Uncharacterized protein n=1 Tax=Adhaeribacter terrigena TaxID=2793070 RepID=A0ABS1C0U5_9BACT|nr:hypothetical protein [Adhaeribacter terrigena]MBK0402787.1 hypothetical protein [Adhaeribacter terrigena]
MFPNEEEFNAQFAEAIDGVIETMAETPEIEPVRFFNMVCVLENLQFFAPVLYSAIKPKEQ